MHRTAKPKPPKKPKSELTPFVPLALIASSLFLASRFKRSAHETFESNIEPIFPRYPVTPHCPGAAVNDTPVPRMQIPPPVNPATFSTFKPVQPVNTTQEMKTVLPETPEPEMKTVLPETPEPEKQNIIQAFPKEPEYPSLATPPTVPIIVKKETHILQEPKIEPTISVASEPLIPVPLISEPLIQETPTTAVASEPVIQKSVEPEVPEPKEIETHQLAEYLLSPSVGRSLLVLENVTDLAWRFEIGERNWVRATSWTFDVLIKSGTTILYQQTYTKTVQFTPGVLPTVEIIGKFSLEKTHEEIELSCLNHNEDAFLLRTGEVSYS